MLLLFRQYFEFMVHFRTIQFGVFLYFFPRKYPTYLLALLRTSGAINQGFPSLQTYLAIFLPATFLHLRKDILQIILDTVPETPPDQSPCRTAVCSYNSENGSPPLQQHKQLYILPLSPCLHKSYLH